VTTTAGRGVQAAAGDGATGAGAGIRGDGVTVGIGGAAPVLVFVEDVFAEG